MTYTYDVATDIGRVRRTIPDTDLLNATFTDEEVQSFLDDEGDWRRATALALETMASDAVISLQVIRVQTIHTDGSMVTKALLDRADKLREQAFMFDANSGEDFEIVETVQNGFGQRQKIYDNAIRRI